MTQVFGAVGFAFASATRAFAGSEVAVLPLRTSGLHDMLLAELGLPLIFLTCLLAILCLPRRPATHDKHRSD